MSKEAEDNQTKEDIVRMDESLGGNSEEKSSLGKPSHRWDGNVKINRNVSGLEGVYLIHLAQYRDQWLVLLNGNERSVSKKCMDFLD
jgi:hypothetical protein